MLNLFKAIFLKCDVFERVAKSLVKIILTKFTPWSMLKLTIKMPKMSFQCYFEIHVRMLRATSGASEKNIPAKRVDGEKNLANGKSGIKLNYNIII